MSAIDPSQVQRREFLQAGALASAAALSLGSPSLGDESNASKPTLPTRKLGKTGVDVTILNHGTWQAPGCLDRLLRTSYASGVRYFDTAKAYGTEPGIAKWLQAMPEVRKNIFLVTKDLPETAVPDDGMLDQRLADPQDRLRRPLLHPRPRRPPFDPTSPIDFVKSPEFERGDRGDQEVRQGEVRRLLDPPPRPRPRSSRRRPKAGFVDAIMVSYTPLARQGRTRSTRHSTPPTPRGSA